MFSMSRPGSMSGRDSEVTSDGFLSQGELGFSDSSIVYVIYQILNTTMLLDCSKLHTELQTLIRSVDFGEQE